MQYLLHFEPCGNEAQDQVEVDNENVTQKCNMSNFSSIYVKLGLENVGPFQIVSRENWGGIGQIPSVSKSNRLHVVIF